MTPVPFQTANVINAQPNLVLVPLFLGHLSPRGQKGDSVC